MDKLKLIKQLYCAFADRDRDTLSHLCSPDIEWRQNPGFPGGGMNIGIEQIIENVYRANASRWQLFKFQPDEMIACDKSVVVQGHYIVQSKQAAEPVKAQAVHIFKFNNQKVISFQQYTDTKVLWDNYEGSL